MQANRRRTSFIKGKYVQPLILEDDSMSKLDILKKIKRLAEAGCYGEKSNATEILEQLKKKYNITETDLQNEQMVKVYFSYKTVFEKKLINQCIYSVVGPKYQLWSDSKKHLVTEVTISQKIELEEMIGFYLSWWRKDVEIFYRAFVNRNRIFCENADYKDGEYTEDDYKVLQMMLGMEKHNMLKQIENK